MNYQGVIVFSLIPKHVRNAGLALYAGSSPFHPHVFLASHSHKILIQFKAFWTPECVSRASLVA